MKGSCNTARQCGCSDATKCDIDGQTGKATCQKVGSVQPGGSCAMPEDCPKGYGCMGAVCKQYCEGPKDTSCPGGGACNPVLFMTGPTGAYYCTRTCDPFSPTSTERPFLGCAQGQRCNPAPDGHTDCSQSGTIPAGNSCNDGTGKAIFNGCAPSSICLDPPQLVCAAFCRTGADDCKSGTCRSFGATHYYVLQTEVGSCNPP